MKIARAFIGLWSISINSLWKNITLLVFLVTASAQAAEVAVVKEAAAGLRLEVPLNEKKKKPMDVAIFTELTPVIVSETPVKLPEKQQPK